VIKIVPFVKRLVSSNYAGKTYQVLAHENNTVLGTDDELFKEVLTIQEIEPGHNFPDMPLPKGAKIEEDTLYVNKKEYKEQLQKEDPSDLNNQAFVSILAKTKIEVACIKITDYADFATNDMLLEIINSKIIFRLPMNKLQESYLEKRNWQMYKKKLMSEVTHKDKKK
jgi:hypothetical protein